MSPRSSGGSSHGPGDDVEGIARRPRQHSRPPAAATQDLEVELHVVEDDRRERAEDAVIEVVPGHAVADGRADDPHDQGAGGADHEAAGLGDDPKAGLAAEQPRQFPSDDGGDGVEGVFVSLGLADGEPAADIENREGHAAGGGLVGNAGGQGEGLPERLGSPALAAHVETEPRGPQAQPPGLHEEPHGCRGSAPNFVERSTSAPVLGTRMRTTTRALGARSAIFRSSDGLSKVMRSTPRARARRRACGGLTVLAKMMRSGGAPAARAASSSAAEATSNPVPHRASSREDRRVRVGLDGIERFDAGQGPPQPRELRRPGRCGSWPAAACRASARGSRSATLGRRSGHGCGTVPLCRSARKEFAARAARGGCAVLLGFARRGSGL